MKSISKIAKGIVAIILLTAIGFIGYRYYLESTIKENDSDTIDTIIENIEEEKNQITYEDVSEEVTLKIDEYIYKIYANFQGDDPLPDFTGIRDVNEEYIELVAYLNSDILGKDENNQYYSYDELNTIIVSLFGKNAHNIFPTQPTGFFVKETNGYFRAGTHGSEVISYNYMVDEVKLGSDGKYYVSIIEYIIETPTGPILDIEQDGEKTYLKNINKKIIEEYINEVIQEDEWTTKFLLTDSDGNELKEDSILEDVKDNIDDFPKTNLVIEHDKELDLYYLKSCEVID